MIILVIKVGGLLFLIIVHLPVDVSVQKNPQEKSSIHLRPRCPLLRANTVEHTEESGIICLLLKGNGFVDKAARVRADGSALL